MAALAHRMPRALPEVQENGIVRGAVFPNAVRDVRQQRGFGTLRDFDEKARTSITYTRLAKIERGEVFPLPEEMTEIAKALNVPVGKLLVDVSDPNFDREAWARDHIEAKLAHRGGDLQAMRLGAAMRVKRLEMGLSTTDMKKWGLPAATASRIENAERPLDRWNRSVKKGIVEFFGAKSFPDVLRRVDRMEEQEKIQDMMSELFSPEAIEARNNKRLRTLLSALPGPKAREILGHIPGEDKAPAAKPAKPSATITVMGKALPGGKIGLKPTDVTIARPDGASADAFALRVQRAVLGPGLPVGSIVIADPSQEVGDGDIAVIRDDKGETARILSVIKGRKGLQGFSSALDGEFLFARDVKEGETVCRVISVQMS